MQIFVGSHGTIRWADASNCWIKDDLFKFRIRVEIDRIWLSRNSDMTQENRIKSDKTRFWFRRIEITINICIYSIFDDILFLDI